MTKTLKLDESTPPQLGAGERSGNPIPKNV